jgi:hypothetical protein
LAGVELARTPVLSMTGLTKVILLKLAVPVAARNKAHAQPDVQVMSRPVTEKFPPLIEPEK